MDDEPVAPTGKVAKTQGAIASNIQAEARQQETESAGEAQVAAIAAELPCEVQTLTFLRRRILNIFALINGNIRTQQRGRIDHFFVKGLC